MTELIDKDTYESIVFDHDFQKTHIQRALDIVRKYIIMNKLLLVGGMAIDFALKAKGKRLYPDNKLPDYDFLSPNFHIDAYNIGNQLAEEGIPSISVILGLHVSTMRVRVNFVPVADISYVPQNIFEKIPTTNYEGFVIVHPHYQMIDQHRALSLPFENPPMETIMQRWDKDIKRNELLYSCYPIDDAQIIGESKEQIKISLIKDLCLNGYLAAIYWLDYAKSIGYKKKPIIDDELKYDENVSCMLPADLLISIISDHPEDFIKANGNELKDNKQITNYLPTLDKIAGRTLIGEYELIHNHGKLISAHYDEKHKFYVANLQTIMCYMLSLNQIYKIQNALAVFNQCRLLYVWAIEQYNDQKNIEQHEGKNIDKIVQLLPTVEVYGTTSIPESRILGFKDFDIQLEKSQKSEDKPKNAYPEKNKPVKEEYFKFNPAESPIYQINGKKIDD